jgi:hypothetical protein
MSYPFNYFFVSFIWMVYPQFIVTVRCYRILKVGLPEHEEIPIRLSHIFSQSETNSSTALY